MWYQSLPKDVSWGSLWTGYIRCSCGGIRTMKDLCPACGQTLVTPGKYIHKDSDGVEFEIATAYMGAEGRYEDWVYLKMLEREWLRPIKDADRFLTISEAHRPSSRAIVVLLFWTYFETRIERLLRETTRAIPEAIVDELLNRYSSVGSRLDRLYKVLFSTTYHSDLEVLGFGHIASMLGKVQQHRNQFMHGHPEAIDDELATNLIENLKAEHESWIAVLNRRITISRGQHA